MERVSFPRLNESGQKVKVLVFSHLFPTPGRTTRAAFVVEQMLALRRLGVQQAVVAPVPWAPPLLCRTRRFQKHDGVPRTASVEGFAVTYPRSLVLPRAALFSAYGWGYYLSCRRIVERAIGQGGVDLIHAHTIMPDGFAAVLLGRELGLPVVCTAHGSDLKVYPARSRAAGWATGWALRRVDRIITVSEDLAQIAQALAGPLAVHVIPNGADETLFGLRSKSECRRRLGLPQDKEVVVYAGNLVKIKGVEFLLEAIAKLRRDTMLLCVLGDGELRTKLAALSARLGVSQQCQFLGARPHDELGFWFSAADCFVLPSLSEGFPTVLAEATMSGVPVVAAAVGGVPEVIENGRTGLLVPPGNSSALAEAIRAILDNAIPVREMVERAQIRARNELTWAANARKTLAVYQELLTGSQPASAAA